MTRTEAETYALTIFIAGEWRTVCKAVRDYTNEVGFCVTITKTVYRFTGGWEDGVAIGLINYPRFPLTRCQLWEHAEAIAERVREAAGQDSYTIQAPDKTVWISFREQDGAK
jgi:hypothetical protein